MDLPPARTRLWFERLSPRCIKLVFWSLLAGVLGTAVYLIVASNLEGYDYLAASPECTGCKCSWQFELEGWAGAKFAMGSIAGLDGQPVTVRITGGGWDQSGSAESFDGPAFYLAWLSGKEQYTLTASAPRICQESYQPELAVLTPPDLAQQWFVATRVIMIAGLAVLLAKQCHACWAAVPTGVPLISIGFACLSAVYLGGLVSELFYFPAGHLSRMVLVMILAMTLACSWHRMLIEANANSKQKLTAAGCAMLADLQLAYSWITRWQLRDSWSVQLATVAIPLLVWADVIAFNCLAVRQTSWPGLAWLGQIAEAAKGPIQVAFWKYPGPETTELWLGLFALRVLVIWVSFYVLDDSLIKMLRSVPYSVVHRQLALRRMLLLSGYVALLGMLVLVIGNALLERDGDSPPGWESRLEIQLAGPPRDGQLVSAVWIWLYIMLVGLCTLPYTVQTDRDSVLYTSGGLARKDEVHDESRITGTSPKGSSRWGTDLQMIRIQAPALIATSRLLGLLPYCTDWV